MTKFEPNSSPVVRETRANYRGRALVIAAGPYGVSIGEKGRRRASFYEVPYESLFRLGAEIAAREARRKKAEEKLLKKKGKA